MKKILLSILLLSSELNANETFKPIELLSQKINRYLSEYLTKHECNMIKLRNYVLHTHQKLIQINAESGKAPQKYSALFSIVSSKNYDFSKDLEQLISNLHADFDKITMLVNAQRNLTGEYREKQYNMFPLHAINNQTQYKVLLARNVTTILLRALPSAKL